MKRLLVCLWLTIALTSLPAPAQAGQPEWTAEQQAVIDAVKNGPMGIEIDFEGWAAGYAGDWSYWRVGDPQVRGRAEHMAMVRGYIDAGNRPTAFEMEPVDVIIRGETALLRLIATESLLSAEGEERVVRYASATFLARESGEWKTLASNLVYLDDEG